MRVNIASYLLRIAEKTPDQPAVIVTRSRDNRRRAADDSITFAELEALSNRYANGLSAAGIGRGMRTLVMLRPGFDFTALVFALLKMGAVPVMIDPGMGVGRMLECLQRVDLQAFIAVPLAHAMRVLRPGAFRGVRHVVTVGRRWFWGGPTLRKLVERAQSCERSGSEGPRGLKPAARGRRTTQHNHVERMERGANDTFVLVETASDETAAILFTSGSTGPAKGVVYEHGIFDAQVRAIQSSYQIEPGEVDLPTFPLFGLFSIAMGMTAVIPEMDPTHPAKVDPAKIVAAIRDHNVTNSFGSPALWKRVVAYCVEHDLKLPGLRRILIAGAPVPYSVIEQLHHVLCPDADVHTPYGATEALPVASISGREVLGGCSDLTRTGAGTCVGRPLPGIDLRIIKITDEPIAQWCNDLVVAGGEIGEIAVSGPVVTGMYYGLDEATALAKIRDGNRTWHRMGDVGYLDDQGRVWFCGRKAHRVLTEQGPMFTVQCEAMFNEHPDVARSALVGVGVKGEQIPVIIIEPEPGKFPAGPQVLTFWEELLELARANSLTRNITHVLFHHSLPVDIRHNVKINREDLATWAAMELR